MPILLLLTPLALAYDDGVVGSAWSGCTDCHGETPTASVEVHLEAGATTVAGGETVALSLRVASPDPEHLAAGLNVATTAGTLVPAATMLWREGQLTHQFPHPTEDGEKVFTFSWTAPAWATEVTIGAAGNAVNYDGSVNGDAWNTDTVVLTVESDCSDADGDLVGDCEGDCDDGDPAIHPGAEEIWYDGVDSDCGGDDDDDADGDGVVVEEDCDDGDPAVSAPEDCEPGEGEDGGATGDGGGVVDPISTGKGCAVAGGGAPWLLSWALLLIARRRR